MWFWQQFDIWLKYVGFCHVRILDLGRTFPKSDLLCWTILVKIGSRFAVISLPFFPDGVNFFKIPLRKATNLPGISQMFVSDQLLITCAHNLKFLLVMIVRSIMAIVKILLLSYGWFFPELLAFIVMFCRTRKTLPQQRTWILGWCS